MCTNTIISKVLVSFFFINFISLLIITNKKFLNFDNILIFLIISLLLSIADLLIFFDKTLTGIEILDLIFPLDRTKLS